VSKGMKASLSNPLGTLLRSIVMFLAGIVLGEHWHPSSAVVLAVTVLGAALAVLHELLSCFLWCSFASSWIGRRSREIEDRR
jgi:nitrate/nitrite transporter NarK